MPAILFALEYHPTSLRNIEQTRMILNLKIEGLKAVTLI